MADKIPMLALSPTMETGTIVKWHKQPGDQIEEGQVLCEVETDKATMEYESQHEGTLLKIMVQEGDEAEIGQTIALVGEEGENVEEMEESAEPSEKQQEQESEKRQEEEEEEKPSEKKEDGEEKEQEEKNKAPARQATEKKQTGDKEKDIDKTRSSPLARKLAEEHGLDIREIEGSGPRGRVVEADVEQALEAGAQRKPAAQEEVTAAAAMEDITEPISDKRAKIAQRLSESKYTAPHYYLKLNCVLDEILAAREKANAQRDEKLSLNAFFVKFTAEALRRHRMVNASWQTDTIIKHGRVDVAMAVAQEEGLITPVVRHCEAKGIVQIDRELKDLIERARNGQLKTSEYTDSTFTITNLGMFGIDEFTAIINPPNSAILALGRIKQEQLFDDTGQGQVHATMTMTMSCDHRLVDGVVGAAFLRDLKAMLEQPVRALF